MRYDPEHKAKTHEELLRSAARSLRAVGPEGVSVAQVMKDAGLTHGGFYAHFRSKDAMLVAAIRWMFESSRARWEREIDGLEPVEALGRYLDWYLSPEHREARAIGCPLGTLAMDLPRMSAKCRAAFAEGTRSRSDFLESLLVRAGHAKAAAEARSIASHIVGAIALSRIEPDRARSDEILSSARASIRARLGV